MTSRLSPTSVFLFLGMVSLVVLIAFACAPPARPVPTEYVRSVPPGNAAKGKEDFLAQGCGSCHKVKELPAATGTPGPDLSNFGGRFNMAIAENRDSLANYIRDPQSQRPSATMPKFDKLSNDQLRDLIAYLASLK